MTHHQTEWEVVQDQHVASNKWFSCSLRHIRHPSGAELQDFYTYSFADVVQVIGITRAGTLVLVKEDRKAAGMSIEAIAGDIELGETPATAAIREFNEETNFTAGRVIHLGSVMSDTNRAISLTPGSISITTYLYVALDLSPSPPEHKPDEIIEVVEIGFEDALSCVLGRTLLLSGHNLPLCQNGTQNIIQKIALRDDLKRLVSL